jgi:hypothetical protein
MRLATFAHAGTTRIGLITGDAIVDLGRAAPALPHVEIEKLGAIENTVVAGPGEMVL